MCCVIRMGGASAGRCASSARVASVPPVDAPMKTTLPSSVAPCAACAAPGARSGVARPDEAAGRAGSDARRTDACAAMRSLAVRSAASARRPSAMPTLGLATKSTAPSSSARKVACAPRSVSVDTITTGIGRRRIRRSRKSSPSMRGISTSSVITSGSRSRISSRAMSGSLAVPMHCRSASRLMISASRLRTSAESSTTRTRIGAISRTGPPNRPRRPPRAAARRLAPARRRRRPACAPGA